MKILDLFRRRKPEPAVEPQQVVVFEPLTEFKSNINGKRVVYLPGLTYNIRQGNKVLADLALGPGGWLEGGLIKLKDKQPRALVNIEGKVEWR